MAKAVSQLYISPVVTVYTSCQALSEVAACQGRKERRLHLESHAWHCRAMMRLCGQWRSMGSSFSLHLQTRPSASGTLLPSAASG